jgi:hypothetical protein
MPGLRVKTMEERPNVYQLPTDYTNSPSGAVLPENRPVPATQGQSLSAFEKAAARITPAEPELGAFCGCGYCPDCTAARAEESHHQAAPAPLNPAASGLRAVEALLHRHEQGCRLFHLLPPGYHGDPADRDEFFFPDRVLKVAVKDPAWGCVEEPAEAMASHLSLAVARTIGELHRGFDYLRPISGRLRLRLMAACWAELKLLRAELADVAREVAS